MIRLLTALTCLLAAAAAQQYHYCDSSASPTIRESDFYLVTRRPTETGFAQGLSCEFNSESDSGAFFVEVQSVRVSSAVFTISSGGRTLFSGTSLPAYQTTFTTPSRSLQVRFDATGDSSHGEGVTMRVRVFNSTGCPPGWAYVLGNCYGTSSTSTALNFVDAQSACNSMRSNLMQVPTSHRSDINTFMHFLPNNLWYYSYTWIGLTDRTSAGRYKHYWLSGSYQANTSEISCVSGRIYANTCKDYERCGAAQGWKASYFNTLHMGDCSNRYSFLCSMPPGGTNVFYSVPDTYEEYIFDIYAYKDLIAVGVAACVLVVGLVIVGVYFGIRSRRARRAAGATSVVVSAGLVAVPPPSGSYPMQPSMQYPPPQAPQYSAAPPNSDAAAHGGQVNTGYAKYP